MSYTGTWFPSLWLLSAVTAAVSDAQCNRSDSSRGMALLQTSHESQRKLDFPFGLNVDTVAADAANAQFLIQGTFGPTHREVRALRSTSHEEWVQAQMAVQEDTHREFYRKYANPRTSIASYSGIMHDPCTKDARWRRLALTRHDIGQSIEVKADGSIWVNGLLRTELPSNETEWRGIAPFAGFVRHLYQTEGGEVTMDSTLKRGVKFERKKVPNPPVFASGLFDQVDGSAVGTGVDSVVFLSRSLRTCPFDAILEVAPLPIPAAVNLNASWQGASAGSGAVANSGTLTSQTWRGSHKVDELGGIRAWNFFAQRPQMSGIWAVTESFTMCWWIHWTSNFRGRILLRTNVGYNIMILQDKTELGITKSTNGLGAFQGSGFHATHGKWEFVCVVGQGKKSAFYVGSIDESPKKTGEVSSKLGGDRRGQAHLSVRGDDGPGYLASFTLWEKALSLRDVTAVSAATRPRPRKPVALKANGKFFLHDSRLELHQNTPDKVYQDETRQCILRSPVNERSCHSRAASGKVSGLTVSVQLLGDRSRHLYISQSVYGKSTQFVSSTFDYPMTPKDNFYFQDFPLDEDYAAQWSGQLKIRKVGEYKFTTSTKAGDASRLSINGKIVSRNEYLSRRYSSASGAVSLGAGTHAILIEYVHKRGQQMFKVAWQGPDTGGKEQTLPASAVSTRPLSSKVCSCGSPGEVANEPQRGYRVSFQTGEVLQDHILDGRYSSMGNTGLGRSMVWVNRALMGKDQLRQRMAWALSQIFVVSVGGLDFNTQSELWLTYYDIFTRNAFGNFNDVLREVTYSPAMGRFLTHTGSTSFNYNRNFPNENYAREVMQLFTIGLYRLKADGTVKRSSDGEAIPTYTIDNILTFSRIFTGFEEQPFRKNTEFPHRGSSPAVNIIDPLIIDPVKHDAYPKQDLDGGYIGDAYPLCSDLPTKGYFSKGARYELKPEMPSAAFVLSPGSPLHLALCEGVSPCSPKVWTELSEQLECRGDECTASSTQYVEADGQVFRFVPPACVNLVFPEPDVRSPAQFEATSYVVSSDALNKCPEGLAIASPQECIHALQQLGFEPTEDYLDWGGRDRTQSPSGCSWSGTTMGFSTDATGAARAGWRVICKSHVNVNRFGAITEQSGDNPFWVQWMSGSPPSGLYTTEVQMNQVFGDLPSKDTALQKLKIGAFSPELPCATPCTGDVKVYHGPAGYDEATIFEVGGRFYKNAEAVVTLKGTSHSFRNPPVFQRITTLLDDNGRGAVDEIDALLAYLCNHDNTPVFIGSRLIQRFGISTPARRYVEVVAEAFAEGTFGSFNELTGKRGDLAATAAAILLSREDAAVAEQAIGNQGALREPLLKFLHLMRSMEYADDRGEFVVMRKLQDVIGQFPFEAPSVFNFYLADYDLPKSDLDTVKPNEPESESEAEEEEEGEEEENEEEGGMGMTDGDQPLVAPELQVLTPQYMIGFLNGITTLISSGVGGRQCAKKHSLGTDSFLLVDGKSIDFCDDGALGWMGEGLASEQTVNRLDLLLTGGRMSTKAKASISKAFEDVLPFHIAPQGENECDFGTLVSEKDCLAVARGLLAKHELTTPRAGLSVGSWDHLAFGCSLQTDGDNAPHYNRRKTGTDRRGTYSLVCTLPDSEAPPTPAPMPSNYHLAPKHFIGCDYGTQPSEAECYDIADHLLLTLKLESKRKYLIVGTSDHEPSGCTIDSADNAVHYNRKVKSVSNSHGMFQPVCSGVVNPAGAVRWHLAPYGHVECDYGTTPNSGFECKMAADLLIPSVLAKRNKTQGRKYLIQGSWGHVPSGCAVYDRPEGGDYAVHFNRKERVFRNSGFTLVCSGKERAVDDTAEEEVGFHLAPQGSAVCDYGNTIAAEYECKVAGDQVMHASGLATQRNHLSVGSWGHVPSGCSLQTRGDNAVHYNRREQVVNNWGYSLVCTGAKGSQAVKVNFHLAPQGSTQCDYGSPPTQPWECKEAADMLLNKNSALKFRTPNNLNVGQWGHIPSGCTLRTDRDNAVLFNRKRNILVNRNNEYSLVCSGTVASAAVGPGSGASALNSFLEADAVASASKMSIQAAQKAIVMSPEFNSFGPVHESDTQRDITAPPVEESNKPYRALVMIFFFGGADTYNLIVPQSCDLYDEYVRVRTGLHLTSDELASIDPKSEQPCNEFGLHKAMAFTHSLYQKGQAAVIADVGNLVQPAATVEEQRRHLSCQAPFSHSNMQNAAQTSLCEEYSNKAGIGGKLLDELMGDFAATSFSMSGAVVFNKGLLIKRTIVSMQETFHEYFWWRNTVDNITKAQYGNPFTNAYTIALKDAIDTSETFAKVFAETQLKTTFQVQDGLSRQMRDVATLIRSATARKKEREVFFTSIGGWDMHGGVKAPMENLLGQVDGAIKQLVEELEEEPKMWQNVTLFTSSEFSRTLVSNGRGSDHGYGGHHLVLGGLVNGGRMYNRFPSKIENSKADWGRGRIVPQYPFESYLRPLVEWMGVTDEAALLRVFPHLNNYNSSHFIPKDALFKEPSTRTSA